jgi:hypothetical protein
MGLASKQTKENPLLGSWVPLNRHHSRVNTAGVNYFVFLVVLNGLDVSFQIAE